MRAIRCQACGWRGHTAKSDEVVAKAKCPKCGEKQLVRGFG